MCLVARHLEALGLPTLCLASADDIIRAGNPPRTVFLDYPLGHTTGRPFAPGEQLAIVRQALAAFERIDAPGGLVRLEQRWADNDDWRQAAQDASAGDQRSARDETPRYQFEADRLLAEGG